jgi:hypothetical protein
MFGLVCFNYDPRGRGGARGWFRGFDFLRRRWGLDRSTVYVSDERYLDRWIVYLNGYTLRLHRFWRGDDNRASHTHPWWFITFPLGWYQERLYSEGRYLGQRFVRPFRFHYRPANFEHYVVRPCKVPSWTIVLTGPKREGWGFYPFDVLPARQFVPYKEWK